MPMLSSTAPQVWRRRARIATFATNLIEADLKGPSTDTPAEARKSKLRRDDKKVVAGRLSRTLLRIANLAIPGPKWPKRLIE